MNLMSTKKKNYNTKNTDKINLFHTKHKHFFRYINKYLHILMAFLRLCIHDHLVLGFSFIIERHVLHISMPFYFHPDASVS